MSRILEGTLEFLNNTSVKRRAELARLAGGQTPEALFITCSDSRIDPNLLTGTSPGELFVQRNAGNFVPPPDGGYGSGGEIATLEYAVNVLKVPHIIICGHSHCGAISAVLNPESTQPLPAVREWLRCASGVSDHAEQACGDNHENLLVEAVRQNVRQQLNHLGAWPFVRDAVGEGRLRLHGWMYFIESGQVDVLNPDGSFVTLNRSNALAGVPPEF